MRYSVAQQLKNGSAQAIAAEATDTVVSNVFEISEADSRTFSFQVTATGVASTTTKVGLQHSLDGTNFTAVGTPSEVTINANGRFANSLLYTLAADAAVLPLFKYCRFVCTTGASDAATITSILISCRT